jgi:hypothetical protein
VGLRRGKVNLFYYLLELIFSFIGGLLFLSLNFIFKIESFFHDKIEFNKYSRWIEKDKEK